MYDHVIIGAGFAGASTAWRLAQRGLSVALVDRDEPASEHGSSHGSARIFRFAYEDALYAGFVRDAEAGWAELEELSGQQLIRRCGSLTFGPVKKPQHQADILTDLGIENELAEKDAAGERWPGIAYDSEAVWQPTAGVLDAQSTVLAMVAAAQSHGAALFTDFAVESVTGSAGGQRSSEGEGASGAGVEGPQGPFTVTAADGRTVEGAHVTVAAGGFLPFLLEKLDLPQGFRDALPEFEIMQEAAFHFPYRETTADGAPVMAPEEWPTFIHNGADVHVYSLPGGRDAEHRGQKLAIFNGGTRIDDASAQSGTITEEQRAAAVEYVKTYVPGLVPEPYAETTCLFTNTPTEDFVLTTCGGITVFSPCSGHGAKFGPLLGSIAADHVTGTALGPAQWDPTRGGPTRTGALH
ncbi:FAD-dependent oxidoreductase [Brevibacterium litoralis]|uniref:FAD-dependent oxidoreductase n=1 Tax=Brevibacterium litoralis TaxID=3138935 RepID=UPI0032F079CA